MVQELGLQGGETLVLRVANGVPKATKLVLQPMTADFFNVADHKALLERQLTQRYTCLSPADIIRVEEAGMEYDVLVQEAAPSTPSLQAVCILNTNCSVEFAEPLNAGAPDGRQAARWVTLAHPSSTPAPQDAAKPPAGSVLNGSLPQGGAIDTFRIPLPDFMLAGPVSQEDLQAAGVEIGGVTADGRSATHVWGVQLRLTLADGDADMHVAAQPQTRPTAADAVLSSTEPGDARLTISPAAAYVDATTLSTPLAQAVAPADPSGPAPPPPLRRVPSVAGEAATFTQLPWSKGTVLSLSLQAYSPQGVSAYTLTAAPVPVLVAGPDRTGDAAAAPADVPEGMLPCSLCGAHVPEASLPRHEAFCSRNNVRCPHSGCGAVLRKGSTEAAAHWHCPTCDRVMPQEHHEKHHALEHTPIACTCGFEGHLHDLRTHRRTRCPHRFIKCRFCDLIVRAGGVPDSARDRLDGFTQHEAECGGRTTQCGVCGQRVQLKLLAAHGATNHPGADMEEVAATPPPEGVQPSPWKVPRGLESDVHGPPAAESEDGDVSGSGSGAAEEPAATRCANTTCMLEAAKPSIDAAAAAAGTCARCFRLLQGHVQGLPAGTNPCDAANGKALFAGLVRAYHAQLSAGCGRAACTNAACASGSGASAPMPQASAAAPAVLLAKLALAPLPDRAFFFCVRSAQQRSTQAVAAAAPGIVEFFDSQAKLGSDAPAPAAAAGAQSKPAARTVEQKRSSTKASIAGAFFG